MILFSSLTCYYLIIMSEIVTWTPSRPKAKAEAIEPRKTLTRMVDAFDAAEDNTDPSVKR